MSQYHDAFRSKVEPDLICPSCGAVNIPGKPRDVTLDDSGNSAACDKCGHGGPLNTFQRKEPLCP